MKIRAIIIAVTSLIMLGGCDSDTDNEPVVELPTHPQNPTGIQEPIPTTSTTLSECYVDEYQRKDGRRVGGYYRAC